MMNNCVLSVFLIAVFSITPSTGQFEDYRCKCICPSLTVVNGTANGRMVYIEAVTPEKCKCSEVVKPLTEDQVEKFCPRCDCRYETRKTKTIQVVIIIIICVVSMLVVYMVFLLCLDPLMAKKSAYAEQRDDDDADDVSVGTGNTVESARGDGVPLSRRRDSARSNVLSRVGQQQDKWKQQVQEQRHAVFDRQTMLN